MKRISIGSLKKFFFYSLPIYKSLDKISQILELNKLENRVENCFTLSKSTFFKRVK